MLMDMRVSNEKNVWGKMVVEDAAWARTRGSKEGSMQAGPIGDLFVRGGVGRKEFEVVEWRSSGLGASTSIGP